jgi:hypothetical protein
MDKFRGHEANPPAVSIKKRPYFILCSFWNACEGNLIRRGRWQSLFLLRLFKTSLLLILICQIPSCVTYSPESAFYSVNPPYRICPRHHVPLLELSGYTISPSGKDEIEYEPGFVEFYERERRHLPCFEPLDFSTTPNALDQFPTKVWYCPTCQAMYEKALQRFDEEYSKQATKSRN